MSTRRLLLLVASIGGAELCFRAHLANDALAFHAGAWLVAGAIWTATQRSGSWLRRAARALAVFLAMLSLLELLPRGGDSPPPEPSTSFADSGGDPQALARWWEAHAREREIVSGQTRLAPGQRFSWFDGEVELDEAGLRRAAPPAPDAFRILAVGGSVAFDTPLRREEPTWEQRLEQAIAEGYACARPVAVQSGGRPGRTLEQLAQRFESEIAPLQPDVILVYPDADALRALPPPAVAVPASLLPERASRLLRAIEGALRERLAARRLREALAAAPDTELLRRSPAARSYRRLLVAARAKGIDVALVTPALAVNGASSEAAIAFHEAVWPDARRLIVARQEHARLVPLLAASYRAISLDAAPELDGNLDAFLDLVHLAPPGREQLARNLAQALAPRLARDVPGCTPRAR